MRDFDDTAAADIDPTEFVKETNWLSPKDAQQYTLIAMAARKGKSQWGPKIYLDVQLEGDSEATLYTIGFSELSPAYHQLDKIIEAEGKNSLEFPFRCIVEGLGRSFAIGKAPPPVKGFTATEGEPEGVKKQQVRPALPKRP